LVFRLWKPLHLKEIGVADVAEHFTTRRCGEQAAGSAFDIHPHLSYNLSRCGCSSVVERQLPKLDVTGSNPVTRLTGDGVPH
jgi:hypothetical protein